MPTPPAQLRPGTSDLCDRPEEAVHDVATPPRLDWWLKCRLGVSYHWGLYSIAARGEWVRSQEQTTLAEYNRLLEQFTADRYDPRCWAEAAKAMGAGYAVLTAKHHDGFCLFDSKLTEYTALHTPARRDLIREYVEAFRAAGLRVGLYYSLVDWQHEDYPAFGDRQHPLRRDETVKGKAHKGIAISRTCMARCVNFSPTMARSTCLSSTSPTTILLGSAGAQKSWWT